MGQIKQRHQRFQVDVRTTKGRLRPSFDSYDAANTWLKEVDYIKLKTIPHIWNIGDRYYKLAATYYDAGSCLGNYHKPYQKSQAQKHQYKRQNPKR